MPINHVALPTTPRTHTRMRAFYQTILSPLGYTIYKEQANLYVGFRPRNGGPDFWLHSTCEEVAAQLERDGYLFNSSKDKEEGKKGLTTHVAFDAGGVKEVERWYKIAVQAGGIPNGEPGERPQYAKGYYAAFVLDPMGNNVEVVYFNPWWLQLIKAAPCVLFTVFGAVAGHFAMRWARNAGWA